MENSEGRGMVWGVAKQLVMSATHYSGGEVGQIYQTKQCLFFLKDVKSMGSKVLFYTDLLHNSEAGTRKIFSLSTNC
jgi:hypothetical protein